MRVFQKSQLSSTTIHVRSGCRESHNSLKLHFDDEFVVGVLTPYRGPMSLVEDVVYHHKQWMYEYAEDAIDVVVDVDTNSGYVVYNQLLKMAAQKSVLERCNSCNFDVHIVYGLCS